MAATAPSKRPRRRRQGSTPTSPASSSAETPAISNLTPVKRPRPSPSAIPASSPAQSAQSEEKDDEEKELESFLFAATLAPSSIPFGQELRLPSAPSASPVTSSAVLDEAKDVDSLFVVDKKGNTAASVISAPSSTPSTSPPIGPPPAVWFDPDDLHHRIDISSQSRLRKLRHTSSETSITAADYQQRLRSVYSNLHHTPSWVNAHSAQSQDHLDPLTSSRGVRVKGTGRLPAGHLDIQPLKDANFQEPAQGVVTALQWHPTAPILMTAGMDCHLRLFSIDSQPHSPLLSLHLPSLPIHSSAFISSASTIITTGRRRFFHLTDTATGRTTRVNAVRGREERSWEKCVGSLQGGCAALLGDGGHVSLVDAKTGQWVGGLKGGPSVRAGTFSDDGLDVWTVGDDEEVYVWDLRTRLCREKRSHPASLHNTAIALSPTGGIGALPAVAIGNRYGIVSLYPSTPSAAASPLREVTSLTTAVDGVVWNGSGELLAMRSRRVQDALGLFHVESGTMVRNWPTGRTPLHFVTAMDFSPQSGYFAVGNDRGRVLLYRLKHYNHM